MKKLFAIVITIILVAGIVVMPASATEKNLCSVFEDPVLRAGYTLADYFKCVDSENEKFKGSLSGSPETAIPIIIGTQVTHEKYPIDLFEDFPYCEVNEHNGLSGGWMENLSAETLEYCKEDKTLYHKVPKADFDRIFLSYFDVSQDACSVVKDYAEKITTDAIKNGYTTGLFFYFQNDYYYVPCMLHNAKIGFDNNFISAKYETYLYGYTAGKEANTYDVYATVRDVAKKTDLGYVKYVLKYDGTNVKYVSAEEVDSIPQNDLIFSGSTPENKAEAKSDDKTSATKKSPKTGNVEDITLITCIMSVCALAVLVGLRKFKEE